jgi:hypothetical protein
MNRTTIAIAKVDKLWCREPFNGSICRLGIVIPKGGTLINHSDLQFMDRDSGGWVDRRLHLSTPVWTSYKEREEVYYYWEVTNTDEDLDRCLKAKFVWTGNGPHVVESVVGNMHDCDTHHHKPDEAPYFQLGLELPNTYASTGHHYYACEPDGSYAYVENGNLPYLVTRWISEGTPGWPLTPKHNFWGIEGRNQHDRNARGLRVSVE